MTNNYFHDVATGLMVIGACTLWVLMNRSERAGDRAASEYLLDTYKAVAKVVRVSFYYILIAGVPRLYFYKSVEWSKLAGEMQVTAIVIKHILVAVLVGAALYYRHKFNARLRELRVSLQESAG